MVCCAKVRCLILFAALSLMAAVLVPADAKRRVQNASDLPRFAYPVKGPASALVEADPATFNLFANRVRTDVDSTLRDYDIDDKATLRELLSARINLQELAGHYQAALQTIGSLRALEEKPAAKLTAELASEAWLRAAVETGNIGNPAFKRSFANHYREALDALPWHIVEDDIREAFRDSQIHTKAAALGWVKTELDPVAKTSGALDNQQAWELIGRRQFFKFLDSVKAEGMFSSNM